MLCFHLLLCRSSVCAFVGCGCDGSCQVAFRLIPLWSSHFPLVFTLPKMPRTNPSERDEEAMHAELSKLTPGMRHLLLTKFDVGRAWAAEVAATDLHCEDMWMQMGTNRDDVVRAVQDLSLIHI